MRRRITTPAGWTLAWLLAGVGWPGPSVAQTTTEIAVGQETDAPATREEILRRKRQEKAEYD
jgi:hypothetical protein